MKGIAIISRRWFILTYLFSMSWIQEASYGASSGDTEAQIQNYFLQAGFWKPLANLESQH